MPDVLKGFLILLVATILGMTDGLLIFAAPKLAHVNVAILIGATFGFLYGLEAALLVAYDLNSGWDWLKLGVDMTWSLPNTIFGFVLGNIIYIFFGMPSQAKSKDKGCIVYTPRSATGKFGNGVKQTLGTLIMGERTDHEAIHLLQERIFGPIYLPFFAANYVFNFVVQCLFSGLIGWILYLTGLRDSVCLKPPTKSSFGDFFGWIYRSNVFEIWAYAVAKK